MIAILTKLSNKFALKYNSHNPCKLFEEKELHPVSLDKYKTKGTNV